ncbi:cytochrome P450 [Rhizobium sp. 2MFCol3.1]|uniref:cytochrome P450 n=1 Tax=Rhizobium sp. 2MFCol3.1 TaxID=1246459 RepID=UPI0003A48F76|nr:cytochrome P450 [Rhizobium sp. 2MFCol3.1]
MQNTLNFEPENLTMAQLDESPHVILGAMRNQMPFFRRSDGIYLILRANDVDELLVHPATKQIETQALTLRGVTHGSLFDLVQGSMLFSNGEVHRNRRTPMTRQFAFRMIEELRPMIKAQCEAILQAADLRSPFEIRDGFASLLPASTIASILGIDPSDIPHFTNVVYRVSRAISPSWAMDELPDLNEAASELMAYVESLVAARRARPKDDFISRYIRAVDELGNLSAAEEIQQLVTVIIGGTDTTRAAMVILVSLLLQHPDQLQAVRDDPSLIPSAVLESLRFEPSVASITRFATDDIVLDGMTVPGGSVITLSSISAMRDPDRYTDPDCFVIDRPRQKWHQAFGGGPHRCLGEALAKAELEEGLSAILTAMPRMSVVGEFPRVDGHAGIRRVGPLTVLASS